MTIILFLVDTSASMCQRALVNGVQKSYLDIAKGAVETFLKFRQRSQDCMGDRYMLLTFEDPPNNVKAGWKENHATFMNELKNLQSTGLTSMGEALKNAFDLLNLNRMQSGIDTYGQGRCPFYLEPSVIIVLTDGGKYTFRNGVHQEIILPLHAQMPGTKLTKEPFRWDQRLFSLVLRMPGHRVEERAEGKVPHDESMIEKMCEVTGGRSYKIKSHYVLNQCIESLVQKVQPGVVIHFDQLITNGGGGLGPSDAALAADIQFQPTKRMIYVPKQHPSQKTFPVGYWPIPEPYWPDPKLTNLPPRDAHPKIKIISPCCDEPQVLRNFPIDKYEVEACPLTLQILSKKEANKVWPLIVSTGMQGEMPFGYLKPNGNLPIVHLYVLPYNYQMLLPLINDLFHKFNLNPPNDWVYKFTNYVKTIPQYYCPFLRRALATIPNVPYQLVQYILPETLDSYLCPAVANYLKQMKNTAKQDQENLCLRVLKQLKQPKPSYHQVETLKINPGQPLKRDLVSHPMLRDTFAKLHSEIGNYDNFTVVVPTLTRQPSTKNYRNPYDIPRRDLIDEVARMRENFFRLPTSSIHLYTKDSAHSLPIADMGNYQEYLKSRETPLRELEPTNVRQHMFGNPYKKDKNMVMVDEADLNDVAPMKAGGSGREHPASGMKKGAAGMDASVSARTSRKRKAGPIRKDYVFKRSSIDTGASTSSASSSSSLSSLSSLSGSSSDLSSEYDSMSDYGGSDTESDDGEGRLVITLDPIDEPPEPGSGSSNHLESLKKIAQLDDRLADPGNSSSDSSSVDTKSEPSSASVDEQHDTLTGTGSSVTTDRESQPPDRNELDLTADSCPREPLNDADAERQDRDPLSSEMADHPQEDLEHPEYSDMPLVMDLGESDASPTVNEDERFNQVAQQPPTQDQQQPMATGAAAAVPTSFDYPHQEQQRNDLQQSAYGDGGHHTAFVEHHPQQQPTVNSATPASASLDSSSSSSVSVSRDMNDVHNISKILKTCHNGDADGNGLINSRGDPEAKREDDRLARDHGARSPPASAAAEVQENGGVGLIATNGGYSPPEPDQSTTTASTTNPHWNVSNTFYAGDFGEEEDDEQDTEQIEEFNLKMRSSVFKEIRRPGRDYSELLKQLELVQGSLETKERFVTMSIGEARRFRRHRMVTCIEEWWDGYSARVVSMRSYGYVRPYQRTPSPQGVVPAQYFTAPA
ncbi:integrator complex subunit 6 [Anopheles aquasalis]|uniref:integrator complex subunit 6 n=1 Tax=Anopheles aquasalis TaxID=42839 RepID=UPI00215A6670|nr:integrator complex subunit 6 [Anopheles aquasalis]